MELVDITKEIYDSTKRLQKGSQEIFTLALEKAKAEREYRKALQIEIMRLKEQGMSVTLIGDLARG